MKKNFLEKLCRTTASKLIAKINDFKHIKKPHKNNRGGIRTHWNLPENFEELGKTADTLYKFLNQSQEFFYDGACKTALKELKEKLQQAVKLGYPIHEDMCSYNKLFINWDWAIFTQNSKTRIESLRTPAKKTEQRITE